MTTIPVCEDEKVPQQWIDSNKKRVEAAKPMHPQTPLTDAFWGRFLEEFSDDQCCLRARLTIDMHMKALERHAEALRERLDKARVMMSNSALVFAATDRPDYAREIGAFVATPVPEFES
jgi:hypothetical protein